MAFLSATYYVSYLIFKIAHDILISISKYIILRRNLMKNFDKFGVMLDCSRNAVPNVRELKRFIKIISDMGYNFLMLYTEDVYEVENEPLFGYKRGRFSTEEIREVNEYAKNIGVELIPCIQTLAHVNAIFRWNDYNAIRDIDDVLLVDDDRTYELIENMFRSLSKQYTSRTVHLGMDEAHNVGLGKYLDAHGYENRYEIIMRHLDRVCKIAKKYGFKPMIWNDMFFRLLNKGVYKPVEEFPNEIKDHVPDECGLVYWDYYREDYEYYIKMIDCTKKLTDDIWFAGGAWSWGGFAPHSRLSIRRNNVSVKACIDSGVKNVFMTLWGDDGAECPYFSLLPALMHAAAVAEGLDENEMKARFRDITGEDFDAFIDLDLPNHIFGEKEMVGCAVYSKQKLYNDVFLGILDNNSLDSDGSCYAEYAKKLRHDAENSNGFKYLFNTMASLCEALEIKYSLGARTRKAYLDNDKAELARLANEEYTECIARINRFYNDFRTQWYTVNKTYGFEVQDARLGGLIRRMESCKDRILDYVNGNIDKIEELNEDIIYNDAGGMGSWTKLITANII